LNHKNPAIIKYLALLSVKQDVYLAELYEALGAAKENGEAHCEQLFIEYRGSIKGEAIFLITKDKTVVVQFRVEESLLYRSDMHFENWLNTDKIRRQMAKQNPSAPFSTLIQNLRHGMKKVNIEAEVLEAQKPQLIRTQYGNNIMLINTWIGDDTGKVKLCLWGEQINSAVVGDFIQIKNASVRTYKGERQLNLGRRGTLSVLQSKTAQTTQAPQSVAKKAIYA
jgi:hypothetical protein